MIGALNTTDSLACGHVENDMQEKQLNQATVVT